MPSCTLPSWMRFSPKREDNTQASGALSDQGRRAQRTPISPSSSSSRHSSTVADRNSSVFVGTASKTQEKTAPTILSPQSQSLHVVKKPGVKADDAATGPQEDVTSALQRIITSQPSRFQAFLPMHHLVISNALPATISARDDIAYKKVINARGEEAQLYLDALQELSHSSGLSPRIKTEVVTALYRLSQRSGLYPSCLLLQNAQIEDGFPASEGSFGEIRKGLIEKRVVCFKVVKIFQHSQIETLLRVFSKEAIIWEQLSHKNILPFYRIYCLEDVHQRICLVSPWLENGNVNEYLKRKPMANCQYLISDAIDGLEYLHSQNIVHADLKGANILVTPSGHACLSDFGLSAVADPSIVHWKSIATNNGQGTARWRSPELLNAEDPDDIRCSPASDMYAFGCVCYEIFTGDVPFPYIKSDATVILAVMKGEHSPRPNGRGSVVLGLDDAMWDLMMACWATDPKQRPTANEFSQQILKRPADDFGNGDGDMLSSEAFRNLGLRSKLPVAANFNSSSLVNNNSPFRQVMKPGQKVASLDGQMSLLSQPNADVTSSANHSGSLHSFGPPQTSLQDSSKWPAGLYPQGSCYQFVNLKTRTVMDLSGYDFESILGYANNNGDNQKWFVARHGKHWTIRCMRGNKYLGFPGQARQGIQLQGVDQAMEWEIVADEREPTAYRIYPVGCNRSLTVDLAASNPASGARVILWGELKGLNQAWIFQPA